jgi:hypothetical protein
MIGTGQLSTIWGAPTRPPRASAAVWSAGHRGNYAFLDEITDRRYPGFPIAAVAADGSTALPRPDALIPLTLDTD